MFEFRKISYEAIMDYIAIVAQRYIIHSLEHRYNTDISATLGDMLFMHIYKSKVIKYYVFISVVISELVKFICWITIFGVKAIINLMDDFYLTLSVYVIRFARQQNTSRKLK